MQDECQSFTVCCSRGHTLSTFTTRLAAYGDEMRRSRNRGCNVSGPPVAAYTGSEVRPTLFRRNSVRRKVDDSVSVSAAASQQPEGNVDVPSRQKANVHCPRGQA